MSGRGIRARVRWALSGAPAARVVGLAWALVQFQLVFGLGLALEKAPYWKTAFGDMVTNLAGAEAIWNAPWTWPPTATHALTAPSAISIVYTDSLPWVVLAFKALGLAHAHTIGLLGGFLLASYLLQPLGMIALMTALGERRFTPLAAGAVLALLVPAWLARQFGHIALTGQWLLLFALAVSVGAAREGLTVRRMVLLALLGALACGIHPYFVPPVAAIALAAYIAEVAQRRPRGGLRAASGLVAFAAAIWGATEVLGYGVGLGRSGGVEGLGGYAMNLLTPIWPHPSAAAGQHWVRDLGWFSGGLGTLAQQFEALNWLGAGAAFAVALTVVLGIVHLARTRPDWRPWLRRFGPLTLAMIGLALWAVGPKGYLGPWKLWDLPLPAGRIGDLIGLFRAYGRFFWAVGYLMTAASLVWLARRLSRRQFAAVAVVACALQLFDQSIVLAAVHARYATPDPRTWPIALDSPAVEGRPWRIVPRYYCGPGVENLMSITQLSRLAVDRHGDVDTANTARPPWDDCQVDESLHQDAAPQDPRITVVLWNPGDEPADRLAPFSGRTDCRRYLHGLICGRGVGAILDRRPGDPAPELRQPMALAFEHGQSRQALGPGWSGPDPDYVWSDGPKAALRLVTPLVPKAGLRLTVTAAGFIAPGLAQQTAEVRVKGRLLARWDVPPYQMAPHVADIPASLLQAGAPLEVEIAFPNARPGDAMSVRDTRELSMALKRLEVAPR